MENINWWKSKLSDIDDLFDSIKKGQVSTLCKSAGGRDVKMVTYGNKYDLRSKANYSSACGAGDTRYYADKTGVPPIILLVGAMHAQELEGTAALLNMINIIENGCDFRGNTGGDLSALLQNLNCRLIIIPIMNPDGRIRCEPDSMIGLTNDELRHWGQGRWKDGALCGWPQCKSVHPIKESAGFLGAYYNDDGINLMHDNFFQPMAVETSALLKLTANEAPDYTILLHGGSNSTNELLQPQYVPLYIRKSVKNLAERIAELSKKAELPYHIRDISKDPDYPPPSFNMTSAIHHICGGVCATYESNQGLAEKNRFTAEDILQHHYILFEGLIREASELRNINNFK